MIYLLWLRPTIKVRLKLNKLHLHLKRSLASKATQYPKSVNLHKNPTLSQLQFANSNSHTILDLCIIIVANMSQNEYNPMQWPPDMNLAQLHYDCCKPGIDNTEGRKCPCCNRYEKLANSKWPVRDIVKDFRNYGGGIPGYFHLLIYFMVVLVVLCGVVVVYHIMLLNQVCPTLVGTPKQCAQVFGVFNFCDSADLYNVLASQGNQGQANALLGIQLATYIILVLSTIGIKVILHVLNRGRNLDGKLYSRFSLIIKNVPLYYQLEDLRQELKFIDPGLQINELFYVFKTCECEKSFKAACDLYFRLKQTEENLESDNSEKYLKQHKKMKEQYLKHFEKYQKELQNLKASSKKVVIVFNTFEQKERIHKALRVNEFIKFMHYCSKILGCKSEPIGYYSERIAEPQEVHWKYIGQSSTHKLKARIGTTIIGIALIVISFAIFFFPEIQIDIDRIQSPTLGNPLNFLVSLIVFILMLIYRTLVVRMIPMRRPSSKLAEGFYCVLTCTIFNFFFYLVSPACFYLFIHSIPDNKKLAELFMTAFTFCIFSLILNILDFGHMGFNGRKKRLLGKVSEAKAFCQSRLHEEITPPAFPVAFKLVMVFNVWIFNSFYVFNIPYLLLFFFAVIFFLYWIDKFILYNHYKMQSYLSLELEHKAQKIFLIVFLVCVSLGYLSITQFTWQRWLLLVVFVGALVFNFLLQFLFKKEKDQEIMRADSDLKGAIERCRQDAMATNTLNIMEQEMKNSLILNDPKAFAADVSQASLATAIFMYGYQQTYQLYLSQFSKKEVHSMLETKCFEIKKALSTLGRRRESQLAQVEESLQQKLIGKGREIEGPADTHKFYEPPKVESVRFQPLESNISKNPEQNVKQQTEHQQRYEKKTQERQEKPKQKEKQEKPQQQLRQEKLQHQERQERHQQKQERVQQQERQDKVEILKEEEKALLAEQQMKEERVGRQDKVLKQNEEQGEQKEKQGEQKEYKEVMKEEGSRVEQPGSD